LNVDCSTDDGNEISVAVYDVTDSKRMSSNDFWITGL